MYLSFRSVRRNLKCIASRNFVRKSAEGVLKQINIITCNNPILTMKAFASVLITTAQCAQLKDDFVPNPRNHIFEYPGVHGHVHQDNFEGFRRSLKGRSSYDYYPVPHGLDYDDFYPGLDTFGPSDELHNYRDISNSDAYLDSDASNDKDSDSFHDSYSGDAGYLHSHGLTHDGSLNSCGTSRCDTATADDD